MVKSTVVGAALLWVAVGAGAAEPQELGRVISAKPVIHQVQVPQQVCNQVPFAMQEPKSGAGAVMGAIAGGAVGSAVGHGGGNAAATALGLMGGAILGDRLEGQNTVIHNTPSCFVQLVTHNTTAYQVEYEYAGRHYFVELPYDPGPTLSLSVSPAVVPPVAPPAAGYPSPVVGAIPPPMSAPVTVMAPPVMPAPVYVAPYPYYGYPYGFYPNIGISFGVGYHRGFRR